MYVQSATPVAFSHDIMGSGPQTAPPPTQINIIMAASQQNQRQLHHARVITYLATPGPILLSPHHHPTRNADALHRPNKHRTSPQLHHARIIIYLATREPTLLTPPHPTRNASSPITRRDKRQSSRTPPPPATLTHNIVKPNVHPHRTCKMRNPWDGKRMMLLHWRRVLLCEAFTVGGPLLQGVRNDKSASERFT